MDRLLELESSFCVDEDRSEISFLAITSEKSLQPQQKQNWQLGKESSISTAIPFGAS